MKLHSKLRLPELVCAGLISNLLFLLVTATASAGSHGGLLGYVHEDDGDVTRSRNGNCIHTGSWTSGTRVMGCDGYTGEKRSMPVAAAAAAAPAMVDSDGDGVANSADRCPGTPKGAIVDRVGCPKDSDKDGVFDGIDQCPNSIRGGLINSVGCVIKLSGVNFATNSAVLQSSAESILNEAATRLRDYPNVKIVIEGYTDSRGDAAYNMDLSRRRAQSAKDYLVAKGISGSRIAVEGFGENNPVADNSTKDGQAKNRRVVLKVVD